jgi:hypothetical protein
MRTVNQPFDRREQAAGQWEGGQRGQQGRERDNHPACAPLLTVKVNIGIARQALHRRGDDPADRLTINRNGSPCSSAVRATWPNKHFRRCVSHPKCVRQPCGGMPLPGSGGGLRRLMLMIITMFRPRPGPPSPPSRSLSRSNERRIWKIKRSLLRKKPQSMLGVLLTQGIAEQLQTLFVAAFNVVDKPRSKLMRTAQCILISSTIQVAKIARKSLAVIPGRQIFMIDSCCAGK